MQAPTVTDGGIERSEDGLFIGTTELAVLEGVAATIRDQRAALGSSLKDRGWKHDPVPVLVVNGADAVSRYLHVFAAPLTEEVRSEISADVAFSLTRVESSLMPLYWAAMRGKADRVSTVLLPVYARAVILRRLLTVGLANTIGAGEAATIGGVDGPVNG